jgi:hypothetical protein
MYSIYKTDGFYTIQFASQQEILINSFVKSKLITGASVIDEYKTVMFKASSVKSYKQFQDDMLSLNGTKRFTYDLTLKMVLSLARQLQYLLKYNMCFYAYTTDDLIVVNDSCFIYISTDYLGKCNSNTIVLSRPFSKVGCFISPELSNITSIPAKINYKIIYYSFGLLIVHALTNACPEENVIDCIEEIKGTKLYWLVVRCLHADIQERCLLYL